MKSRNWVRPASVGEKKLKNNTWRAMPIAMPPSAASGNDFMRPISAAVSPASSVSGPIVTSSVEPCWVA